MSEMYYLLQELLKYDPTAKLTIGDLIVIIEKSEEQSARDQRDMEEDMEHY